MAAAKRTRSDRIRNIVTRKLGIAGLDEADQREIITEFEIVVFQAIYISFLEGISEEKREEFLAFADTQDLDGMRAFLQKEVPDYEARAARAVKEELRRFKKFRKELEAEEAGS